MNLYDALKAIKDDTVNIYLDIEYEDTRGVIPDIVIKGYDYSLLSKDTLERKVSRIGVGTCNGSIVICTYEEEDKT